MYVVAITRWARPATKEAMALAPLLGIAAYDVTLRISGPLPVVFARVPGESKAVELLTALRDRGHGALACDLSYVHSSQKMASPRSYVFDHSAFVGSNPAWGERTMPYQDILALIRGSSTTSAEARIVDKRKRLSLGRAMITGGLVMRKTKTTERRQSTEQHEQVLYLVRRDGRDPMILREHSLRHQGLGPRVRATSIENFATLVTILRERAPGALYDDRLLTQRRKSSLLALSGPSSQSVTTSSNASENDLAAHLIAVAHLRGQL